MKMKITFKNFRHHRDATFVIPDSGLTMISGDSGKGKTTILKGIAYAMYGKIRKPYSHGKKSCQVTLEMGGLEIMRSNSPNILKVRRNETEYVGEAAQGLIKLHFWNKLRRVYGFLLHCPIRQ